jgi:hypothetical protein
MRGLRTVIAMLLAIEALNSVLWSARILSAAAAYGAVVLVMVLLRVATSALQATSAWMLTGRALPALTFSRVAVVSSAVLLTFEIGLRLSPSSILPGLRWPAVVAYGLYALLCLGGLALIDRADRSRDRTPV